jgi:FtsP/CotA-like multicopper oxidase with cupredoxin domain
MGRFEMDRREFVKSLAITTGVFGMSGFTALLPTSASAAAVTFAIAAEPVTKTLVDGTEVLVWQFRDLNNPGPGRLGAGMAVSEGDPIDVTLYNGLDREVSLVIPGVLGDTAPVVPGNSRTYSLTAPAAGTYLIHDGVNGDLGRAMGLAGPMIVMPADGSSRLYPDGPGFDRQYTLVLHELDSRVNLAVASGGSPDMADYEPDYFFVNGLSYPNTKADDDTLISMNVSESVALRFVNGGVITNPMHFHGYHVMVATRNREIETRVVDKDTVLVGVDECVDVILHCDQPGTYPLHTHYVPGVTANGVYLNPHGGALLVMSAS